MLYLNTDHLQHIGTNWNQLINTIEDTVRVMDEGDYAQPLKPYLRYGNKSNRIIAMPAFVGGQTALAGIKWIASFPANIRQNIPRAHSVTILNEQHSGKPLCTINTTAVSAIRTAAVTGLMIKEYMIAKKIGKKIVVGIIGFGVIGRMHLKMVEDLLGSQIEKVFIYDTRPIDPLTIQSDPGNKISIASSWQECYEAADLFITCTVATQSYIDLPPVKGSLQLNISLRDYRVGTRQYMDRVVVDDWEEVCRENTDIENMHRDMGLQKENTVSIADVVCRNAIGNAQNGEVIMFNPMGMAIFDIAIGAYYYKNALANNIGITVPE
jgi:ornithine cyclodeaminase